MKESVAAHQLRPVQRGLNLRINSTDEEAKAHGVEIGKEIRILLVLTVHGRFHDHVAISDVEAQLLARHDIRYETVQLLHQGYRKYGSIYLSCLLAITMRG